MSLDAPRHFKNTFDGFDVNKSGDVLAPGGKDLSDRFKEKIRTHRNSLLRKLYDEYSHTKDKDPSIYTGKSGVALLYLFLADSNAPLLNKDGDDPHSVSAIDFKLSAQKLVDSSLRHLGRRRVSFLCGDAGPLALAIKMNGSKENLDDLLEFLPQVTQVRGSDLPDELLYGRVGYLYALNFVQKGIHVDTGEKLVKSVIEAVLLSGQSEAKKVRSSSPLMYQWHGKHYVGAAHGMVGILFLLLRNRIYRSYLSDDSLQNLVRPTLDYIQQLQFKSGNFPSSLGNETDRLIHWCHGSPGAVHLFLEAALAFPNHRHAYMKIAEDCAQVIWERGLLKKGYGLCHGVSGNGYAFVHLFQATGNPKYLYYAAKFAEFCFDHGQHGCNTPDRPYSLFEGLAGTIYFLSDILNPAASKFPAFYT